jgi:CRISPR associated protein Cas1
VRAKTKGEVRPDDGKISEFCTERATPMSDDPPICKSNGFALQRKPTGGTITLNAASIWGISGKGSSAFVFDMMEPERPKVDRSILEFVKSHKFHAADFVIRSDGVCRLNPAMARVIVQVMSD